VGSFGEKLRKQREQRGIALEAICNATKISPRMLRALEEEHFGQLPGGVFNKGFVRAYARQVGLNEEEAVADYLTALRESQIQQQPIVPNLRVHSAKPSPAAAPDLRGQKNLPNSDALVKNVRVPDLPSNAGNEGHGLRTEDFPKEDPRQEDLRKQDPRKEGLRSEERRKGEDRRANPVELPPPVPKIRPGAKRFADKYPAGDPESPPSQKSWVALPVTLLLLTLLLAFWSLRRHRDATAASHTVAASNQSPAPASMPTSGSTAPPKPAKTTPAPTPPAETPSSKAVPAAGTTDFDVSQPDVNPPAVATNRPRTKTSSTLKPPPTFTLLIRAEKNTWISIVADGKPVAEETLIAPAHTTIRASHEIYVRTGNAAGVSFVLNRKEFSARGDDGEARTYIFNATGLQGIEPATPNQ
jgi:cytoskeletal protein RodZ